MEIRGIKINVDAIAEGVYDLFDEEDRTVMAFGMIPSKRMEPVERAIKEKVLSAARSQYGRAFEAEQKQYAEEVTKIAMAELGKAMYRVAKNRGGMVV